MIPLQCLVHLAKQALNLLDRLPPLLPVKEEKDNNVNLTNKLMVQEDQEKFCEVVVASEQKKSCRIRAVLPWLLMVLLLVGVTVLAITLKEEKANNVTQTSTLREVQEKLCEEMGCTDNWKRLHCSCYSIYQQNKKGKGKSFKKSRKDCEDKRADLATITTPEEQEFVLNLTSNKPAWVGLKSDSERVWRLGEGTLPTSESSESSSREEKETCAFIKDIKSTAQPKSLSTCSSKLKWVCEKRIE